MSTSPLPTPNPVSDLVNTLTEPPACAAQPGSWCAWIYQWTNSDFLARQADAFMSSALRIALIVVIAVVVRALLHRAISRIVNGATENGAFGKLLGRAPRRRSGPPAQLASERRTQRARTIGSVLRSITSAVILLIAAVMILAEFGVALGPILASAGIVGVAVGFGAQNLVRDFLSGMFMLLEDQYGVGDIVDLGTGLGGQVEAVGLRITTIRDHQGTVWYVRNGEILRVGNKSQGYAVAVVDLPLAHTADLARAAEIAGQVASERVGTADLTDFVLEDPEVLGVESVTAEAVTLRLTVKVRPGRQFAVQRALNLALTEAFDAGGIPLASATVRSVTTPAADSAPQSSIRERMST